MLRFPRPVAGRQMRREWLVSNGDLTVGPVDTELLVRGVMSGKIPQNCRVSIGGEGWRELDQVREVRRAREGAASGPPAPIPGSVRDAIDWLSRANDLADALSLSLYGACLATGAHVGLLSWRRPPLDLPVVSANFGPAALGLGETVPETDACWVLAEDGEPRRLHPTRSDAARASSQRLGGAQGAIAGLALIPLRSPLTVVGIMELGRFDHAFRANDPHALVPLVTALVARVEELAVQV